MENFGTGMSLQEALVKASRTADIPREILAEIQETLGPISLNGDSPEVSEDVIQEESEVIPPLELDNVEPFQVLTYMQVAIEGDHGWVGSGKANDKTFRARIRDDTGIERLQLRDVLLGLEQDNYVELSKKYSKKGIPIVENARLTKEGGQLIEDARKDTPEVVAEAERRTKQRFVWQVEDMRHEIYYESKQRGAKRELTGELGTENGQPNPMTTELGQIGLQDIVKIPKQLATIQKKLIDSINSHQ